MLKSKKTILLSLCLPALISLASCASQPYHESTGQFIDSSVITTKVKAKLLADDNVKALPITVKTYKSTVQLSGFVNNNAQRLRAAHDARSVEGVGSVQNLIVVKTR